MIERIVFYGSGNVATQLAKAFLNRVEIEAIISRNEESGKSLADHCGCKYSKEISNLDPDSLILVCVQDDEIPGVLDKIPENQKVAVTSGNFEIAGLSKFKKHGIFYPLQTFSAGRTIDLFEIPFLIEASDPEFAQQLSDLAWKISRNVHFADSQIRNTVHIAAVFANNFVNHLFLKSENILKTVDLNLDILAPLIRETISKAIEIGPMAAQTGPARRNDTGIIQKQVARLEGLDQEIYKIISKSILEIYHPENDQL